MRENMRENELEDNTSIQITNPMGASKKIRRASEYSQKGYENMKNSLDVGLRDSIRPQQNEEPTKIRVQQTAD